MASALKTSKTWGKIFGDQTFVSQLSQQIEQYILNQRWYAAKGQETKNFKITFNTPLGTEKRHLLMPSSLK